MTKTLTALLIAFIAVPNSALATEKLRGEVFCFPTKGVPKLMKTLKTVEQDRREVVNVNINPKFLIKDGGVWPEQFFLQLDDAKIDIPVEKPSGLTPTFIENALANPDSEVCVRDKTRADRPEDDEGLYFEMGLSPLFHNRSGRHEMAELKVGAKDGKMFYKKMLPPMASMFMPDTRYLAVKYEDMRLDGAQIFARTGERDILLTSELYKEMHVVSLDDLEDLDATSLVIKGGPYRLLPTVSVATMKRFGWGQKEDE